MNNIRVLVLDADGVLTDGRIYYTDAGEEMKSFDTKDGHGLKLLMRAGIQVAIITGRVSRALEHRARELGIEHVIQNAKDKHAAMEDLCRAMNCPAQDMAYMGDDVVDLPAMAMCSVSFAPQDAMDAVKARADYVTTRRGGSGAVREAVEIILKQSGKFDEVMARYAL